ncbi:hypothetical protein F4861DRAFT_21348 [Xylaria intraflava]|nr:hypothetical protein F4861DRAFT_21348 [Xylaria intraflava]
MNDSNSYKQNIAVRRAPMVRMPQNAWRVTESNLDPMYRATSRSRPSPFGEEYSLKRVLIKICATSLTVALVWYLWPDILNNSRRRASPTSMKNGTISDSPFWRNYRVVMSPIADVDEWFEDVDDATRVIQTMWTAMPAPKPREEASYKRMKDLMSLREKQVRFARAEWDAFLDTRTRLISELMSAGTPDRVHVDDLEESDTRVEYLGEGGADIKRKLKGGASNVRIADLDKGEALDNETISALATSTHGIIEKIDRMQTELFGKWDPSFGHVHEALKAEHAFIWDLRASSPKGNLWTGLLATGLLRLDMNMERLQQRHEDMKTVLMPWRKMFRHDIEADLKEGDRAMWVKRARELLRGWTAVLVDIQEDTLITLRREDANKRVLEMGDQNAVCSWDAWKSRNCGGTSCFGAPGIVNRIKAFFGRGKPVAGAAVDEANWWKSAGGDARPRIWRGVYEKACCETETLSRLLRNGSRRRF